MAYTLEISYFNSVVLKQRTGLVTGLLTGGAPPGIDFIDFTATGKA